jgi:hypothetical protein
MVDVPADFLEDLNPLSLRDQNRRKTVLLSKDDRL